MSGVPGNTPRASNAWNETDWRWPFWRDCSAPTGGVGLWYGGTQAPRETATPVQALRNTRRFEEFAHGRKQAFDFSINRAGHGGGARRMRVGVRAIGRQSARSDDHDPSRIDACGFPAG